MFYKNESFRYIRILSSRNKNIIKMPLIEYTGKAFQILFGLTIYVDLLKYYCIIPVIPHANID